MEFKKFFMAVLFLLLRCYLQNLLTKSFLSILMSENSFHVGTLDTASALSTQQVNIVTLISDLYFRF